jgi:tetratricopeptide (TPR) repeat protein
MIWRAVSLFTLIAVGFAMPKLAVAPDAWAAASGGVCGQATRPAEPVEVPGTLAAWAKGARFYDGLGRTHRAAGTKSAEAQRYFDQGMDLLWAFNHDESTRSFAKAAALDPSCAMCWWGVALTVGPNYNVLSMPERRATVASQALKRAQAASRNASPADRALISALAKRYPGPTAIDDNNVGPILTAYAEAMRSVADKFPDDLDIATLAAEALMTSNAWKLWNLDGTPAPGTEEIVARLKSVLARNPAHPGANHYYIHAVEASPHPENATASADRLTGIMPGAGHLVHMPSHIYHRIGRYEDAVEANRRAVAADLAYLKLTTPPDYYAMYTAHNYHFLAFSAAMEGRKADADAATAGARAMLPDEMLKEMPGIEWIAASQYTTWVRFGDWPAILAMKAPDPALAGLTAHHLWATGIALAATGKPQEAQQALKQLEAIAHSTKETDTTGNNRSVDIVAIQQLTLKARIAEAEGKLDETISRLSEAVEHEDALSYDEPSNWFFPARHLLGRALMLAGKAREAEAVDRADLVRHPANGWALAGLAAALRAEGNVEETARVEEQLKSVWARADIRPESSAY